IQSALNTMFGLGSAVTVTAQPNGVDFLVTYQNATGNSPLANSNLVQLIAAKTTLDGNQPLVSTLFDGAGNTTQKVTFGGAGAVRIQFNGVPDPGVNVNEIETLTNLNSPSHATNFILTFSGALAGISTGSIFGD